MVGANEKEAIALARQALSYLPSNNVEQAPFAETSDALNRRSEALNSIVPDDPNTPYSMHDAIEMIVDKGSFLEIQAGSPPNAIVGLARLGGRSVGIVSQEPAMMAGVMDINSSDKISRFVRMCDAFNLPIVTFVDSPPASCPVLPRNTAVSFATAPRCFSPMRKPLPPQGQCGHPQGLWRRLCRPEQ